MLIALSTTFQDHETTLQRIVDALAGLPVRGVLTTGPAVDPNGVRAPANVRVVRSAPHGALLREATVAVTHAGHGTVMKSLAAGVPMLCLPMGRDQNDNAARVVAHGAGMRLRPNAASAKIARAVQRLIAEPRFEECAARLGEAVRADAERGAAVQEVDALTSRRPREIRSRPAETADGMDRRAHAG